MTRTPQRWPSRWLMPAAELFRGLGAARDQSVLAGPLAQAIGSALRDAGVAQASLPIPGAVGQGTAMAELVRSAASQRLLLDLIEATLPGLVDPPASASDDAALASATRLLADLDSRPQAARAGRSGQGDLRGLLLHRLQRWQRSIARDAQAFDGLDEARRHVLRKHVKRLRYAVDASDSLLTKRSTKALSKSLRRAQKWLGELNDLATAQQAFAQLDDNPVAWFARGWLVARQQVLLDSAKRPMKKLARRCAAKRFADHQTATAASNALGKIGVQIVVAEDVGEPRAANQSHRLFVQFTQQQAHFLASQATLQLLERIEPRRIHQNQPVHLEHQHPCTGRQLFGDGLGLGNRAEKQRAVEPEHKNAGRRCSVDRRLDPEQACSCGR